MAYDSQKKSLIATQKNARELEKHIKNVLKKKGIVCNKGEKSVVLYSDISTTANVQADIAIPSFENPRTIMEITHTNPDKPGHSNENKLHQKIGALYLWKTHNPNLRVVLVMGGKKAAWLSYVEKAFRLFFDEVVTLWDSDFDQKLLNSINCQLKNLNFWNKEKERRDSIKLEVNEDKAPISTLRIKFYKEIIKKYLKIGHPRMIKNEVLQYMALCSYNNEKGLFWDYLTKGEYDKIWQERSLFNPMEAIVYCLLDKYKFKFEGDLLKDIEVKPNLLHEFGIKNTKISEDFVLFSKKHNVPVHIQCKASSGGMDLHTKALPSRAREQITRSLFARCSFEQNSKKLISKKDRFILIYILDGKWRTPKNYKLKYIHNLQFAGATKIYSAESLVNENLNPNYNCNLIEYLKEIGCEKIEEKHNN